VQRMNRIFDVSSIVNSLKKSKKKKKIEEKKITTKTNTSAAAASGGGSVNADDAMKSALDVWNTYTVNVLAHIITALYALSIVNAMIKTILAIYHRYRTHAHQKREGEGGGELDGKKNQNGSSRHRDHTQVLHVERVLSDVGEFEALIQRDEQLQKLCCGLSFSEATRDSGVRERIIHLINMEQQQQQQQQQQHDHHHDNDDDVVVVDDDDDNVCVPDCVLVLLLRLILSLSHLLVVVVLLVVFVVFVVVLVLVVVVDPPLSRCWWC